jgi:hypothetical protein
MARPPKSGLEYFPLDVDFFEDEKVIAISREFGVKGEAVALRLLCAVYRQGYFAVWGDGLKQKLLRSVPGLTPGLLEQIVSRLVKWDFFDKDLFHSAKVLTSRGVQRRFFAATKRRQTGENPAFLLVTVDSNGDIARNNPVDVNSNRDTARSNGVNVCNNSQRKEEDIKPENAAAPARELPPSAETVTSPDCLARFRTYCDAWNAVVGKPRIMPDIPHYADKFAITEHHCQDITIFSQVIEHLQKHPQSVIRTGKISLKTTTIFSVDFVMNVVSGAYDTDFSQKQSQNKRGGRYCPNPADYTGEF